jgi:hypothetical protein
MSRHNSDLYESVIQWILMDQKRDHQLSLILLLHVIVHTQLVIAYFLLAPAQVLAGAPWRSVHSDECDRPDAVMSDETGAELKQPG